MLSCRMRALGADSKDDIADSTARTRSQQVTVRVKYAENGEYQVKSSGGSRML